MNKTPQMRMMKIWYLTIIVFFIPIFSYAADETGLEPHMLWRVIDFVIFCGILFYFLRKPVYNFFKTRKESIINELEEAKKLKEESEKLLEETKRKLELLEKEIQNIIETFDSMAENERKRIMLEIEKTIERIKLSIEEEKNSLITRAKSKLLHKISEDIIENLRRRFEKLSEEEHEKVNNRFIRSLGE